MLFQSQIDRIKQMLPIYHRQRVKNLIRIELVQMRRIMRAEEVERFSTAICQRLEESQEWQNAHTVLCYYPFQNEVDIRPLLERYKDDKVLLLPAAQSHRRMQLRRYTGKKGMHKGRYGILVPSRDNKYRGHIDLIIVPGVAFDKKLNRLGRGGGYYDRFLRKHTVPKVAIAYDFQIVPDVPTTFLDRKVNKIITPTQIYE